MKKIVIDPGHGGTNENGVYDPGALGGGLREAELTFAIAGRVQAKLAPYDADVQICPRTDSLYLRADFANNLGADYFCSIHINAGSGTGFESYVYSEASGASRQLQDIIHGTVMAYLAPLGIPDRGRKQANFAVLRETEMPAILLENLFIDNADDAAKLKDNKFLDGLANEIAWGLVQALGLTPKQSGTPATGKPAAILDQAREFLRQKAPEWVMMADLYYNIAPGYKIRPDVALCQACKETAYFRFSGTVKADQNNFCGLKLPSASGNTPADHASFPDRETGIEAHVQHLAAYFTTDPITNLVDPRFELVVKVHGRGKLKYVEDLGGKWAPDLDYGKTIVKDYLGKLLAVAVPAPTAEPAPDPCLNCQRVAELMLENKKKTSEILRLQQIISEAVKVLAAGQK